MSKSRKKYPIVKDKTGRWYNKTIRRTIKRAVRDIKNLSDILSYYIPNNKEIVNQYDICDYKLDFSKYLKYPKIRKLFHIESEKDFEEYCDKMKRK